MRRWTLRHLAAVAVAGLLVGLLVPASASARTPTSPTLRILTGTTTVTTAPGVVTALRGSGIAALVTPPGRSRLIRLPSGPALVASYPVTGGSIGLAPARAVIRHIGGLALINLHNGKRVRVDRFVIDVRARLLTAHVVGTLIRIPLFRLDLSRAVIRVSHHVVTIDRVRLFLTRTAAVALNTALRTRLFAGGLPFGTAHSRVVVR